MTFTLAAFCITGWLAGFLLLRRVPEMRRVPRAPSTQSVAVIIPARDEEANLPALLISLKQSQQSPSEVIVVDDHSTDATAAVAHAYGAELLPSAPLPDGWTGKTWACHQGAVHAHSDLLLFLDADTRLAPDGYARILGHFASLPAEAALSVLPFHTLHCPYEELSLFFNILTAMGAGGFTGLSPARLFGPSLLLGRSLYMRAGGHEAVRTQILENLHLADRIEAAGGVCFTVGGAGVLFTRMFPHGFAQLQESWRKAFVAGAKATAPAVLALSVFWLSAACLAFLFAVSAVATSLLISLTLYLAFVIQVFAFERQIGSFRFITALLYPIPLAFYFFIFSVSALRSRGQTVVWKGRRV